MTQYLTYGTFKPKGGREMDKFYERLGERVKKLREEARFSQERLSQLLKISRVSISQIENGERKIGAEEIAEIAKIFNVSPDILLDFKKDIKVILEKKIDKKHKKAKKEIRISVPQKNAEKFKEVLLYILNKIGSKPNIGESVLYKLLYFIDFNYYEKYEEQLIGATYIKNHYGPTPIEFIKIVEDMEGKDLIRVQGSYFQYPQTKYLPLRTPDMAKINVNGNEQDLIDNVLNTLSNMNATQISDYSHNDVPWLVHKDGDVISYESVFYRAQNYSVRTYDDKL